MSTPNPFLLDLDEISRRPAQPLLDLDAVTPSASAPTPPPAPVLDLEAFQGATPTPPPPAAPTATAASILDLDSPIVNSPLDAGLAEATLLDKVKSFGVMTLGGAVDVAQAAAAAPGYGMASEDQLRKWTSLTPEERQSEAIAHGLGRVSAVTNWMKDVDELQKQHEVEGFWTSTLPHGLGTTLGIGAAGLAAAYAGAGAIPAWATAALLGSTLGTEEALNDALNKGATPEQATLAAGIGAVMGTTEAIPVTRILDRVDTATGGVISKTLNRVIKQKLVGSVLKEGLKGALEEGIQEAFQQGSIDVVAALSYDPERSMTESLGPSAAAGGSVGFLLSSAATALGIPLRIRQQEQLRQEVRRIEAVAITGQPLDPSMEAAIQRGAEFTPLTPDYLGLVEEHAQTVDRLEAYAKGASPAELEQRQAELQVLLEVRRNKAHPFAAGVDLARVDKYSDLQTIFEKRGVNRKVELGLPPGMTVAQALEQQPVVVMGFRHFSLALRNFRQELLKAKEDLVAMGAPTTPGDKQKFQELKSAIQKMETVDLPRHREWAKREVVVGRKLKDLAAQLAGRYLEKGTKLVLSGDTRTGKAFGSLNTTADGRLLNIEIDLEAAQDNTGTSLEFWTNVRTTFLHEFGHAMSAQSIRGMKRRIDADTLSPEEVLSRMQAGPSEGDTLYWMSVREEQERAGATGRKSASNKDYVTYRGLLKDYLDWAEKAIHEPFRVRFETASPPIILNELQAGGPPLQDRLLENPGYWYSFEEYIAENVARTASQRPFVTESAKGFFKQFRADLEAVYKAAGLEGLEAKDVNPQVENWIKTLSLEGKIQEWIDKNGKRTVDLYDLAKNKKLAEAIGLDTSKLGFNEDLDTFQKWWSWGLNILQLGRKNPHIEPLQRLIRTMHLYNQTIGAARWRGHNTLTDWKKLGRKQGSLVGEVLLEETLGGQWYSDQDLAKAGLGPDARAVYKQIHGDLLKFLDRVEGVLMASVREDFAHDPAALDEEMKRVQTEMAEMRSKPFFPLMRFGRWTWQVRADEDFEWQGKKYKKNQLVDFPTFEKERLRNRARRDLQEYWRGQPVRMSPGYITDSQVALQGTPAPILRALRRKMEKANTLTPEVAEALDNLAHDALPIESFKRHWAKRKKIKGFSLDARRAYAAYTVSGATHLSRVEHQDALTTAVEHLRKDARTIAYLGGNATRRGQIADVANKYLNYLLNPQNDWPILRSVGFSWFLGFNLKSALVNSTQLLVVTHPYLAARFGDVKATKAMARSFSIGAAYWAGRPVSKGVLEMLAKGKADGVLEESLATQLAIARGSNSQTDLVDMPSSAQAWARFSEVMALPFYTIEKMNRFTTAIAAFELYKAEGMNDAQSTALALEAVRSTQYEYAQWARPAFMRGKLGSNLFLFKSFMQNQLFSALGNNPESSRVLFSMLVLAGLLGLPFAEDLLDLLDLGGEKLKRQLGWKNPKVQSRQAIRELLISMDADPDLFLYGLSDSSMGLGYLGDLMGMPFPEVSIQGSVSSGNVIPGTTALKRLQEKDPNRALLDFMVELGGAEASYMGDMMSALTADNPDQWKRWEQSLPTFLRSLSKAGRYAARGGEATARGEPIAEFDPDGLVDQMELALQAIGFTPTSVTKGWESYIAQREIITYYETWKTSLLRNHNYSRLYEDPDQAREALAAVRAYNQQVPYPELRITADTLMRSLETFARQRAEAGRSIPTQRSSIRISREIRELYSD